MNPPDKISELITALKKEGVDFTKESAVFKWFLDEHPGLQFTLIVQGEKMENTGPIAAFTLH
jgi:hypothetical protein